MHETKSRFLNKIINDGSEEKRSFGSERQLTAQAFNLHVEKRDGRHAEGFPWSLYGGYSWNDEGEHERLVVLFGGRAVEIEGHHLGVLINEIREGQLNLIRELTTSQGTLLAHENPNGEPVITSVKMWPDFEDMLKEIKGEDERETRHAKRFER